MGSDVNTAIEEKDGKMTAVKVHDKTFNILISSKEIKTRVAALGRQVSDDYRGRKPLFIGVLNGAFLFAAEIFMNIDLECEISFIKVSSYSGLGNTGKVREVIGIKEAIEDRDVIIIEDIVDTGDTALFLMEELSKLNPRSIRLATLLFKPAALRQNIKPDYVGFEIDPLFVVGFGLDYDGYGRNLNDIFALIKE